MSDTYTEVTLTLRRNEQYETIGEVSHTFRSEDEDLTEFLDHMTYFLQGCSFSYVKGLVPVKDSD